MDLLADASAAPGTKDVLVLSKLQAASPSSTSTATDLMLMLLRPQWPSPSQVSLTMSLAGQLELPPYRAIPLQHSITEGYGMHFSLVSSGIAQVSLRHPSCKRGIALQAHSSEKGERYSHLLPSCQDAQIPIERDMRVSLICEEQARNLESLKVKKKLPKHDSGGQPQRSKKIQK